jgi:hypothetical protein
MLFLLGLIIRAFSRLVVGSHDDDGSKDLEILVLRHQLRVLRRKTGPPKLRAIDRVVLAAASRSIPRERWSCFLVTSATVLRWLWGATTRSLGRRRVAGYWHPTPSVVGSPAAARCMNGDIGVRPERPERQLTVTRCRLSVKCLHSARVIRCGSVVLTSLVFPRGSVVTQTHGSLG